jgi:hypothetical protein
MEGALPKYQQAFEDYGLRPGSTDPEQAAALLRGRPAAVNGPAVAALEAALLQRIQDAYPDDFWTSHHLGSE